MQKRFEALRASWRAFLAGQDGMQTMEWILLLGLIGTVLLGLMAWFDHNQDSVGTTIWGLITHWLDKMKV